MNQTDIKSETLNLRISSNLKAALRKVAKLERRSLANILEVLIAERCEKLGIPIETGDALHND
ncbi:hypothetical protein [Methylotenera sp.]|uniref:hypothetical protein n=1 Tax=Methylotenera sp. TaxID=2051956 RepID=UPI00272F8747|nr:hypothetical protein [Methylotenera sp.]MDP2071864.1 hypothetical protein [Methylotenera sp.]MDP3005489.1 hypothetical protein [Methylotenera sp.]